MAYPDGMSLPRVLPDECVAATRGRTFNQVNIVRPLQRLLEWRFRGDVPSDWQEILDEVHFVGTLDDGEKRRLVQLSRMFESVVRFDTRGDIEINQRMIRLTIVQACRLILALGYEPYRYMQRVTFLPDSFDIDARQGRVRALGAADERGHVALSWREVLQGLDDADGRNVVYHEFAHVLDAYDGVVDGKPNVGPAAEHQRWQEVVGGAYERHRRRRRKSLIDAYGRTSEIEFFAEVVEVFFERPEEVHVEQRELYEALADYFNQRPGWLVE